MEDRGESWASLEWAHVSPPLFHTYEELPFVWQPIRGEEFLENRHN